MSFLPVSEENKEAPVGQTTNQPGQPGGQPPPVTSGGSVGAGQTGGGTVGSAGGSSTQFGSSASKLGDYLSANAPQVQQQSQNLAAGLTNQYNNLNQGITNAANQFQQQVGAGYNANNPDVINQALTNPTKFAADPNNIKAFQGQYNDTYTGPTSFIGSQGYGDIQGKIGAGQSQANLLGTTAGLQSYLQNQSQGGPNNTVANNTLDALLMTGNPQGRQAIQQAAGQFGGLTGQLTNATTGADQSVKDAQKAAQDAQAYAKGKFDPYVQDFGNQINQGAQTAEAARTAYNNSLNNFYSTATPIEQRINQWAGSLPGNQSLTDLFAPAIATSNKAQITNPITAANFSTPEQYAKAAALQQLGGAGVSIPLNQSDLAQAGKATAPLQTALPNISNILAQYKPDINRAEQAAIESIRPTDVGDVGINQIYAGYNDLAKYLNQYNPTAYPDTWDINNTPVPTLNAVNTPTPVVTPTDTTATPLPGSENIVGTPNMPRTGLTPGDINPINTINPTIPNQSVPTLSSPSLPGKQLLTSDQLKKLLAGG